MKINLAKNQQSPLYFQSAEQCKLGDLVAAGRYGECRVMEITPDGEAVVRNIRTAETFHALPCDCDLIERGKQDPAPMGNNGPTLPSGWGDLYNRDGYRRGRVHVSHVPETLRYPHVVIVGANDYPLRELVFGETDVLGDRHATVSNGVWTVIMDAVIAA